jgi:hypothetical protein
MKRFRVIVAALLLAAFGLGPAQGGDKEKGTEKKVEKKGDTKDDKKGDEKKGEDKEGQGKGYDSPEKVFNAFVAAVRKGDGKAICACLTRDAAATLAGRLAAGTLLFKGYMEKAGTVPAKEKKAEPDKKEKPPKGDGESRGGEKSTKGKTPEAPAGEPNEFSEVAAALTKVFTEHGLDREALKEFDLPALVKAMGNPRTAGGLHQRLARRLKEPCAFLGDLFRVFKKFSGKPLPAELSFAKEVRLKDLKVEGDTATAVVTRGEGGGADRGEPIAFTKEQGGWKISEAAVLGMPFGGARLNPPPAPPRPPAPPGGTPNGLKG